MLTKLLCRNFKNFDDIEIELGGSGKKADTTKHKLNETDDSKFEPPTC